MGWIDTIVVGLVIVGGLFIFYKALKEPADMFFALLAKGFVAIKDKIYSMGDSDSGYEVIKYG